MMSVALINARLMRVMKLRLLIIEDAIKLRTLVNYSKQRIIKGK